MQEGRHNVVTMKGDPLTLLGPELKVGDDAPDFVAVDMDWNKVRPADFAGKIVLISAVPSVDTPVCSTQTKRFSHEAAHLPDDVAILMISQDLPFALSRFCGAEGIQKIRVVSDHVAASFGKSYGVLIAGLRLLARSIFVIDRDGKIVYMQIVPELTDEPDYDAALEAARRAAVTL